jgi:hypothetical protein
MRKNVAIFFKSFIFGFVAFAVLAVIILLIGGSLLLRSLP